jgi:hydroxymethylbilane synthase
LKLKVATRGSALALWQTEWVIRRLHEIHGEGLEVEILTIRTRGDQVQNVPIAQIGGKGVFVKEIESALLSGAADFAVHSLKDMPAALPPGLALAAIPEREDPRDALVLGNPGRADAPPFPAPAPAPAPAPPFSSPTESLTALPIGATVGTTSRRRGALLLHERPDLRIEMLRGNLDTRLHKLQIGPFDAAVLAAAGLRRLGFADRIAQLLPVDHFVPCAGQGALGVEAREGDERVRSLLALLEHPPSATCTAAERAALRRLNATCEMPLGIHALLDGDELQLYAMLASPDGRDLVRITTRAPASEPDAAGHRLAEMLIDAGGDRILASLLPESEG